MYPKTVLCLLLTSITVAEGCQVELEGTDDDAGATGSDSASDSDTNSDTDTNTDADSDPDSDADTETETDTEGDNDCLIVDPHPALLLKSDGLTLNGFGTIRFLARDGNTLTAYTYRSQRFDEESGPILFIMHGAGRTAESYLSAFDEIIERNDALGIAPEFPKNLYPGSEDYNLGVGTNNDTPYGGVYDPLEWRSSEDYTHSEVEHLFESVKATLRSNACQYVIYGHSAGGQFVHRLLTFRPDVRIRTAVAANPGWWTLPGSGGGNDPNFYMPYGLQGAPPDADRQETMFAKHLVVLLGEDDLLRDEDLRQTQQADAQGPHRFARGQFYYAFAAQMAADMGVSLNWDLDTVPGVGHSNGGMAPGAEEYLFP